VDPNRHRTRTWTAVTTVGLGALPRALVGGVERVRVDCMEEVLEDARCSRMAG
jgi:hypothetical protein